MSEFLFLSLLPISSCLFTIARHIARHKTPQSREMVDLRDRFFHSLEPVHANEPGFSHRKRSRFHECMIAGLQDESFYFLRLKETVLLREGVYLIVFVSEEKEKR